MSCFASTASISMIAILACAVGSAGGDATAPRAVRLGAPFSLGAGAGAVIRREGLEIEFTRVAADSRCPRGAHCIVEGDATIVISVSLNGVRASHELRTPPSAAAEVEHDNYRITLQKLAPHPEVDRPVRPARYVATLLVVRR
jgi:hypothetical protein